MQLGNEKQLVEAGRRAIRAAYFLRIPNVGDRIVPSVVSAVTQDRVRHYFGPEPHLLAIGSIMAAATPASYIWGTGVMHTEFGIGQAQASHIHALRGQLTCSALRQAGVMVADVPLGDPAYLGPRLLGILKQPNPGYRVGVAAHYVDRSNTVLRRILREPGTVDLNVHDLPEVFLARMAQCETVISSSLHGLVFAEALGIPNLWITAGDEIAGGDFKFRDWFSTTRRPQTAAYVLSPQDSVDGLARAAECHESTIDMKALHTSFPRQRVEEMAALPRPTSVSTGRCRTRPLPVFLISFNRGRMLQQAIASIRRLARPCEIVVHDNGSTCPDTRRILGSLEASGIRVVRCPAIASPDELNQVQETIENYFADWDEPGRYVVSDCDIDLSITDPRALDIYDELLNNFRKIECVGPMLRIRDIARSYPLFNRVMNRHIEQFWRHLPTFTETSFGRTAVLAAPVDTTFALHRAGEPFRRLKSGLRVYEPFEALHLDWYYDPSDELTRMYAETANRSVSHWNNPEKFHQYRDAILEYT